MKVTAAITTYNRAAFLPGALESVFAQTRQPRRGARRRRRLDRRHAGRCSQRYGDRIRVVRQENAGRSGARNRAVEEARGELLSFLDSDDRWLPDKLERQVPVLEGDERVAMVHGHVDVIGADGELLADETQRHHELFSAAHRNGVTYAGLRVRLPLLLVRADRARRRDPRRRPLRPGAPARRLRPLPPARARPRDRLPRRAGDDPLPPPRGADDDLRADDGPDPDGREAPAPARRSAPTSRSASWPAGTSS